MNYKHAPYPVVECQLDILRENVKNIADRCHDNGITVAGVMKGINGHMPLVRMFDEGGCDQIASSRLEQLYEVKKAGITKPTLLLRIPMLTEIENVAQLCDVTLISEIATMDALKNEN